MLFLISSCSKIGYYLLALLIFTDILTAIVAIILKGELPNICFVGGKFQVQITLTYVASFRRSENSASMP